MQEKHGSSILIHDFRGVSHIDDDDDPLNQRLGQQPACNALPATAVADLNWMWLQQGASTIAPRIYPRMFFIFFLKNEQDRVRWKTFVWVSCCDPHLH